MPVVTRDRTVAAPPEAVWRVVSDPHHLPRWWPGVRRVEEVTEDAWTKVLASDRGRAVRADYSLEEADPPRLLRWRQELLESPFERFLRESRVEIALEPAGTSGTRVAITAVRRLRGLAWLGGLMVRRATRRQVDEALDGLSGAVEG